MSRVIIHGDCVLLEDAAGLHLAPCSAASPAAGGTPSIAAAAPGDSGAESASPRARRKGKRKRSRQAEYMRRKREAGVCRYCAAPCAPTSKSRCVKHLEAHRELMALYRSGS